MRNENWQKENKAKSVIKETKTAVKRDHLPAQFGWKNNPEG